MIVTNSNFVNGSAVPQYEPDDRDREYQQLKKSKKDILEKARIRKAKAKLKILRNILLVFIIGLSVIWRYSLIYKLGNNLAEVKNEIYTTEYANEDLTVQLIKLKSNVSDIEEGAMKNLKMVQPDKNKVITVDLEKDNFKTLDNKPNKKSEDVLNYIKEKLF